MRREERVTVQGPVKEHQPDGMSHRGCCDVPSTFITVPPRSDSHTGAGQCLHPSKEFSGSGDFWFTHLPAASTRRAVTSASEILLLASV